MSSPQSKISLGSLGGTITMTHSSEGGITPSLNADQLVKSVPGLGDIAEIHTETLSRLPGASLQLHDVLQGVLWAKAEVDKGAAGVVLIQGTDTLEETAWLAELVWDRDALLVFVGGMRGAAALSADGPANIMAACRVILSPESRGKGVFVVLDDVIHHASLVYKSHSTALSAFKSYGGRIVGRVIESQPRFRNFVRPAAPIVFDGNVKNPYVPAWTTYLGDDGTALRTLIGSGVDGLVLGGLGVGHFPADVADVISELASKIPVVFTSNLVEGGTMENTYGFHGSEIDMQNRGAIPAGGLNLKKSRILLWLLLGMGMDSDTIKSEFRMRGSAALV